MNHLTELLIRFDDICPTMNWDVFQQLENKLNELNIRPMVAVIPDNKDKSLDVSPPVPDFWDRVRGWQRRGWSIGLHGYQHEYVTNHKGIIGLNSYSEFAGLSEDVQMEKIRKGLAIFETEGIKADLWIAPAHSFDWTTLSVLSKFGIRNISDGFSRWPYMDNQGFFWVPQQLWEFESVKPGFGVATMCFHINGWSMSEIKRFHSFMDSCRSSVTSLPEVHLAFKGKKHSWTDTVDTFLYRRLKWSRNKLVKRLCSFFYHRGHF